uniref:Uncharacterized protein n=1 Tax=Mesocestoides corti TaxID=53468 RepID=A0A5K3ETJ8_MESCO
MDGQSIFLISDSAATSAAFREQCERIFCFCRKSSATVEQTSYQDQGLGSVTNGGSIFLSPFAHSTASSNVRLGASVASVFIPSRRLSSSSLGSRVFGAGERRTTPRARPSAGLSRTVLNDIGERVQLKLS